jgi:hypothetical protein
METAAMHDLRGYDGNCEQKRTAARNTVATLTRRWIVSLALAVAVAACGGGGGGKPKNTYARASHAQEQCCEQLAGDARAQCLQALVKVEDPAVAATRTNQDTYACVARHFVCDPSTGHATQASAQAQLECIQDLDQ